MKLVKKTKQLNLENLPSGSNFQDKLRVELEDWACLHIEMLTNDYCETLDEAIGKVCFEEMPTATLFFLDKDNSKELQYVEFDMEVYL